MRRRDEERVGVAPKISTSAADWYKERFDSLNGGVTWALQSMPFLYQFTVSELRGTFTRNELWMILDTMNGTQLAYEYSLSGVAGGLLEIEVYDTFRLYPGVFEEKWDVDKDELLGKINSLSRFERCTVELWAIGFWQREDLNNTESDEGYLKIMLTE